MSKLDRIVKKNLCLGCGLCESLGKEHGCKMQLSRAGFYIPVLENPFSKILEKQILSICPAINLVDCGSRQVWGVIDTILQTWATDDEVRYKGSSGGSISALCIYMLEHKIVDAVLQIGPRKDHVLYNQLHISRTREDILANASSRYAPAPTLVDFLEIMNSSRDTFCFVGKPCDVSAVKNLLGTRSEYQDRIKLFLAIICAGMPSYNASRKLLDQYRPGELPVSLRYRGDGWPGNFKATYTDHSEYKVSYNESWGRILGRQILFRCKICPDGIGLRADLVAGDAWETSNGYPDFTERPGKSFVLVRTPAGADLFRRAQEDGAIQSEKLDIGRLSEMQPFQYQRRVTAGFRVFTVQLLSGFLLNLKRMHLLFLMRHTSWYRGMRNVAGIFIRYWRLKDLE